MKNIIKNIKNFFKDPFFYIIFFINFILVYRNMVISPKFSMVFSQYNQSIFYISAKLMKIGKIPYVDFLDHKGIYIFFINYIAEIFNNGNHIGLYIIGSLFISISAYMVYKISLLLLNNSLDLNNTNNENSNDLKYKKLICFISSILYSVLVISYDISYSSLQCETFISTFLLISIFLFLKNIISSNEYNIKNTFVYGLLFSFILFIKANYNLLFLIIGLFILIDNLKNKNYKNILNHIRYGLLGIFIASLPAIIYSIKNNIIPELIENTLLTNMKYSNAPYPGTDSKFQSLLITLDEFKFFYLLLLISIIVFLIVNNKKAKLFIISSSISLFVATLTSLRPYTYYLIEIIPFICFALAIFLSNIFDKISLKKENTNGLFKFLILTIILVFFAFINTNTGFIKMKKNGEEQLSIAKKIDNIIKHDRIKSYKKDYDIYIVGRGLYMYEYLDKLPKEKYFVLPVIDAKYYREPYDEVLNCLKEKRADIVVLDFTSFQRKYFNTTDLQEICDANYRIIGSYYDRLVLEAK